MTMSELKDKARRLGMKTGKMRKTDLVHAMQEAEGFTPCYGIPNGFCPQMECCFRDDCYRTKMLIFGALSNDKASTALDFVTKDQQ